MFHRDVVHIQVGCLPIAQLSPPKRLNRKTKDSVQLVRRRFPLTLPRLGMRIACSFAGGFLLEPVPRIWPNPLLCMRLSYCDGSECAQISPSVVSADSRKTERNMMKTTIRGGFVAVGLLAG